MRHSFQRRLLQIAVAIGGVVPVGAGLAGVVMGTSMVDSHNIFFIDMDSHYRYLSGLLLGIGLAFWSTIPKIEKQGERFRLLTALVVVGGFSRLVSVWVLGWPGKPMLFGLGMELIITPLLAFWQFRLQESAKRH